MPLRIAICDDAAIDLQEISALVEKYASSHDVVYTAFTSVEPFLAAASQGKYDVVLLDIEMPERNGYIVAKEMLEWDAPPLIVFVTNSMEYTIRGYGVAFRYLPKPISYLEICDVLDAVTETVCAEQCSFSCNGTDYIIKIKDIYYFEVYDHWTTIHFADGSFQIRSSLKSIRSSLPQHLFGVPHNSYLVNFSYIKTASATELRLSNGAVIPVSRRNYSTFDCQFRSFLRKK